MAKRFIFVAVLISIGLFTACNEPRRTPDGHLMDRPKMSAYGPDDITRHDTKASDADNKPIDGKQ
ncbi:MAG: hypothetical protein A4S08_08160 [Proteobacteria bacterium SG_bin4]|nr:MAG: hypothetical protein A4S08_08160 [Proteobacteria bacterium SG_bin4]